MNKQIIIAPLLALITLAGQGQVKCYIEGELRDTTQGKTVVICLANVDLRVSDNYITTEADAQGHFSCNVETDTIHPFSITNAANATTIETNTFFIILSFSCLQRYD